MSLLAGVISQQRQIAGGTLMVFGFDTVPPTDGGFPGQPDRALTSQFTKSNPGDVTAIYARFRNDTVAGNARICAYTVSSGEPGSLLWSSATAAVSAGGGLVSFGLPGSVAGTYNAGNYFLVGVVDEYDVNFAKSNTAAQGASKMANGTFSFASPPATWPGTDANYDGPMSIWCEYLGL